MAKTLNPVLPLIDPSGWQLDHKIYTSSDPEPLVRTEESLWQFLRRVNPDGVAADKTIMEEHENRSNKMTYGCLHTTVPQVAAAFQHKLGLKPGDTIAVVASNTIKWILVAHGAMYCGITIAAVSAMASTHELVHYLSSAESKVVFTDVALAPVVHRAIAMTTYDHEEQKPLLVTFGAKTTSSQLCFPDDFMTDTYTISKPFDLYGKDNRQFVAAICFSSGTSGSPKAVQLSHHNLIAHLCGTRASQPHVFNSNSREVFYAPFAHIYGLVTAVLAPTFTGGYVRYLARFELYEYIRACAEVKTTMMRVVPPTANAISKDPQIAKYDLSSVRTLSCAGAALGDETLKRLQKLMPAVTVTQGYGMTEAAITSLKDSDARRKAGSVGSVMVNSQVRMVDEELKDVKQGEPGEILVRGHTIFMGYKNNPAANAEAFPFGDGWLRTGDVGVMDPEGFLYLTDRRKDLIKYKGNQVPPAELEDVLMMHPLVTEAAVCGRWDSTQETEVPLAYVNLQPNVKAVDHPRVLKEVQEFVASRVAGYKRLRGGVFYNEKIPRNPTGKLLRRLLPARIEEEARIKSQKRATKL